jgi:hypothetical protein
MKQIEWTSERIDEVVRRISGQTADLLSAGMPWAALTDLLWHCADAVALQHVTPAALGDLYEQAADRVRSLDQKLELN